MAAYSYTFSTKKLSEIRGLLKEFKKVHLSTKKYIGTKHKINWFGSRFDDLNRYLLGEIGFAEITLLKFMF